MIFVKNKIPNILADFLTFQDMGHLFGICLEVVREEPLPDQHPYLNGWSLYSVPKWAGELAVNRQRSVCHSRLVGVHVFNPDSRWLDRQAENFLVLNIYYLQMLSIQNLGFAQIGAKDMDKKPSSSQTISPKEPYLTVPYESIIGHLYKSERLHFSLTHYCNFLIFFSENRATFRHSDTFFLDKKLKINCLVV